MAATAVRPAMNADRLFPLFTKTNGSSSGNGAEEELADLPGVGCLDGAYDEPPAKPPRTRKPRKPRVPPGQKTLQEIVNPQASAATTKDNGNGGLQTVELQPDDLSPRRSNRRRTSQTGSVEVGSQDEETGNAAREHRRSSPQVIIHAPSPLPTTSKAANAGETAKTPPKKMLRLKDGGKFSSPPTKKVDEAPSEPVKRRGRQRKAKEPLPQRHLISVCKYHVNSDIGTRISRIMEGEERYKPQVNILPRKQGTPRKANAKSAHPFFSLDKRKPPPQQLSPRKASAVTPGKLRRENMHIDQTHAADEVLETWTSTLLKDRLMFRHPGAKEPAWPDREQTHVRGLVACDVAEMSYDATAPAVARRKRKSAKRSIPQHDSLLRYVSSSLEIPEEGKLKPDGFRGPDPSLRLPKKSLLTGQSIAESIAAQLSVPLADSDVDEIVYEPSSQQSAHAALQPLYDRITDGSHLTAFDESRGEALSWTSKYTPSSCAKVLQPARQTKVLKDWLLSLKVTAVDSAPQMEGKRAATLGSKQKKRKRRRKDDDLDDFLVDSDEEVHDMDELTDPEDVPTLSQGRKTLSSIVQVTSDGTKLSNAVLISGPHGCGKTAAAHAVAKELGFKIFEISSSERRSGRDVLDKVGDMTENHLVKHHGIDSGEQSSTEEPNARLDEAFQRDLASGRQGKMASFFKPQSKPQPKKQPKLPKDTVKAKATKALASVLKKPAKDQQQSLILLEEVDILFKEDKDFWSTVLKLIVTSKRPCIMTCNDEDLVPLQAMSLHAILRFFPPPLDLATDYLLLVAAAEGHLLERNAVSSLYRGKGHDLRAAIAELDFWCQMGVGDPRGGLSWVFQRYPPDSDSDEKGRRLRVVSEGTYQTGMGAAIEPACSSEDKILWSWREAESDPATTLGWETLPSAEAAISMKDFCRFANDLSAVDVYARSQNSIGLDASQKPLADNARLHYIAGLPLLQTDEEADHDHLSSELLATSTLLAFTMYGLVPREGIAARLKAAATAQTHHAEHHAPLARQAFSCFDTISIPAESALSTASGLQQSVFDGPLEPIAIDIAPYVRSIVHFDLALAEQREALGGGTNAKRARTTRAARSALEGGQRASTRRERWFPKELDLQAVLQTGGEGWPKLMASGGAREAVNEEVMGGNVSSGESI